MILSDRTIKSKRAGEKLFVSPIEGSRLQPAGGDIDLGNSMSGQGRQAPGSVWTGI